MQPVLDVVSVDESLVGAPWEPAPLVSNPERSTNRRRNRARAAPDVQNRALVIDNRRHHPAITRHASQRLRGNVRSVFERCPQRPFGRREIAIDMNDHLATVRSRRARSAVVALRNQ